MTTIRKRCITLAKKTYVLDTNVLLDDPKALNSFQENDIIIPLIVIEELDRHKDRNDSVGMCARETARLLNHHAQQGANLREGFINEFGGLVKVVSLGDLKPTTTFDVDNFFESNKELGDTQKSGDNRIVQLCYFLNESFKKQGKDTPILVSKDVLLRVKSNILGIPAEDRKKDSVVKSSDHLYKGYRYIQLEDKCVQQFYEDPGSLYLPDFINEHEGEEPLHLNEFVIFKDKNGKMLEPPLRYCGPDVPTRVVRIPKIHKIKPKNLEQIMALDLLLDPTIKLVTLSGPSGVGKSILSIAAGLQLILDKKVYKSMLVSKPVVAVGQDIGFLPGLKEEKLMPWLAPLRDNLRYLISDSKDIGTKSKKTDMTLDTYFDLGIIEMEAITYMRGRSISDAFMFIDEIQNISSHELKTIITRVGENAKIVLTGDVDQIDNLHLHSTNNGLAIAIEKFKNESISGHVTLEQGVRSELATLAAKIL